MRTPTPRRDRFFPAPSILLACTAVGTSAAAPSSAPAAGPPPPGCSGIVSFVSASFTLPGTPREAALGDLDSDGDLDLIIANGSSSFAVGVMLNDGAGNFAPAVYSTAGTSTNAVALGDLDGDHDLDVIVSNSGDISVLLNTGGGVLAPAVSYPAGTLPRSVRLSDVDGDGDLDAVVVNSTANTVSVLMNLGGGTFAPPVPYPVSGTNPQVLALGDLDGDSRPEIVTADTTGQTVSLLINTGAGTFTSGGSFPASGVPRAVLMTDMTGDGALDVVYGVTVNALVGVLPNGGNGQLFGPFTFTGANFISMAAGDLDADGDTDLMLGQSGATGLADNTGFGLQFASTGSLPVEPNAAAVTGDIDGDGDLDAVLLGVVSLIVARNTGEYAPHITSGPASSVVCPGGSLTLSVDVIGTGPFTYQWRRDAQPLKGATERTLTLTGINIGDAGSYDVVVTGACTSVTSSPAVVGVGGVECCTSDFNGDGVVNSTDVSDFINAWFGDVLGCG